MPAPSAANARPNAGHEALARLLPVRTTVVLDRTFQLTEILRQHDTTVTSVTITGDGNGNEATDITSAKLYLDVDNDGIPELIGEYSGRYIKIFDIDLRREKSLAAD